MVGTEPGGRLRIGIDGRAFSSPLTGISRYIREMCAALTNELPSARFFVYSQVPCRAPVSSDRWTVVVEPLVWARRLNSFVWFKLRTAALTPAEGIDVYWANTGFSPCLAADVRVVASLYDMVYRVVPQTMRRHALLQYRAFFERDLRRADAVVALSQGTAERARRTLGIDIAAVAPPGVSRQFSPPTPDRLSHVLRGHQLETPYFLAVGTLEPRKNLNALVDAFERWHSFEHPGGCELVLVGDRGWRDSAFQKQLRSADPRVRSLGRVSDDDLPALYAGAVAFVYPSLYEGFGLPVLEARACGAQIIASDTPEIREAGGTAPAYVRPDAVSLAGALSSAWRSRADLRALDTHSLPAWQRAGSILAAHLQPS